MSKMTKIGDYVRCPKCGGEGRVVWVFARRETSSNKMRETS